jgi:hypothetical protein
VSGAVEVQNFRADYIPPEGTKMSLYVGGRSKQFEIVDEGECNAVLGAVQDLGEVMGQYGMRPKVRLVWVSDQCDSEGNQKIVLQSVTNSLHEKSTLGKVVKAMTGYQPPDNGEFDLEPLVGKQQKLVIEHSDSDGRTYANVTMVLKPNRGVHVEIPQGWHPPAVKPQPTGPLNATMQALKAKKQAAAEATAAKKTAAAAPPVAEIPEADDVTEAEGEELVL